MPSACAPTVGRVASNVAIAGCFSPEWPRSRERASLASSLSLPPSSWRPGMRTSSSTTSAVCDARMPCLRYFWPWLRPFVPGPMTKLAWPRPLSSGSTAATTTWTSAMPAVGDPRLRAVEHPLVAGLVVHRARAQAGHVGAGVGLAHAERPERDLVRRAVALRDPLDHLLGRAVAGDAGGGEARAHDRHADAGVAPEQLLDGDRQRQPRLVLHRVEDEVDAVEPDLGGLLDDRVGELLALVPLRRRRAHDALGEVVDPLLDLQLVLVESGAELGHGRQVTSG